MHSYIWFMVFYLFLWLIVLSCPPSAFTGWIQRRLPGVNGSFRQRSGCRLPCHYARNLGWSGVMGEGSVPMGEFASAHRCRNKKFHYGICSSGNLAWFLADLEPATFSNFAEVCFFLVQVGETMIITMDKFQRMLFSKRAKAKGLWCDDHGCGRLESIGYRSGAWLFW